MTDGENFIFMEQLKAGLKDMQKKWPDEEFVLLINPKNGQGGFKLLGCDVIAHPGMEPGTITIVLKKELEWNVQENFKKYMEGDMTELDKLEKYLKEKRYKYKRIKETPGTNPWARGYEINQIIVYNENGDRQWDAVCHRGSYGFEQGLLEIMGSIVKPGGDSVEGWLTAEEIIKRLGGK